MCRLAEFCPTKFAPIRVICGFFSKVYKESFLMTGNLSPLVLVVNRFSDLQKEQIEALYMKDVTFREICHDYAECVRMRETYTHAPQTQDTARYRQEYEALIEALEEEMYVILRGAHAIAKDQKGTRSTFQQRGNFPNKGLKQ